MTLVVTFAVCHLCNTQNSWNSKKLLKQRVARSLCGSWSSCYLSHLHLAPPLGVIPSEFRSDLLHNITRVPELSCGGRCFVILCLPILVQHWLVTDRKTDRQTDRHRATAYRPTAVAKRRARKKTGSVNNSHRQQATPFAFWMEVRLLVTQCSHEPQPSRASRVRLQQCAIYGRRSMHGRRHLGDRAPVRPTNTSTRPRCCIRY